MSPQLQCIILRARFSKSRLRLVTGIFQTTNLLQLCSAATATLCGMAGSWTVFLALFLIRRSATYLQPPACVVPCLLQSIYSPQIDAHSKFAVLGVWVPATATGPTGNTLS
jgi:hypothetical protein